MFDWLHYLDFDGASMCLGIWDYLHYLIGYSACVCVLGYGIVYITLLVTVTTYMYVFGDMALFTLHFLLPLLCMCFWIVDCLHYLICDRYYVFINMALFT